ncbi:glycosyl transferase family 90-domain-containing protein [Naematelia encephala]|uniref:Glycosyl transferase family 90-domain-containing protein n=1 Tax=Naematelia encephala TaxID=71784 RepID=A0A1Y2BBU3_9TREE|nr:glycosyl transferase family 90-domain-containing protein [Naematelia encephala]
MPRISLPRRIPLPRRGLRSIVILFCLLFIPYILFGHISTIHTPADSAAAAASYISRLRKSEAYTALFDRASPSAGLVVQDRDGGDDGAAPARHNSKGKRMPQHNFRSDGLLEVNSQGQHPIFDLVERAKRTWANKQARASQTLGQAVDEYRRRYGRPPPKGFDRWWAYAKRKNVQLPDEYDQIHRDLEPFHALPPSQIQDLVREVSARSGMITITCPGITDEERTCTYSIVREGLNEEGTRVAQDRAEAQMGLLEDIEDVLEEVQAVFYSHDGPWQFVGHAYKSALEDAAAVGEYLDTEEQDLDTAYLGWASACAPHKPLRESYDLDTYPDLEALWQRQEKTFIWDHKASMDPCNHPTTAHLAGFLSGHGKGPGPGKAVYPAMAMCKTGLHSDVLAVSMEAWTEDVGVDPPWEGKEDRLLWRGSTTGIYFNTRSPWNISQRVNLVSRTAQRNGHIPVLDITDPLEPVLGPVDTSLAELNGELMDVGFSGQAMQCDPEVCAKVNKEYNFGSWKDWNASNKYKYLLDIDGNGWSARFKRLMTTNSVVLKSTIFPEWYTDRVQPWVHYIPIKPDLTDLYDVLSFFHNGHDDMAKEMAVAGKEWSKSFWRWEDMVAYQFRLMLELSRLAAPDRDEASYHIKGSEHSDDHEIGLEGE